MKAFLFGLLFIVSFNTNAQITIPRTVINSYTLEAVESLTAEVNGRSLHVTRNESVFTIHGVNLSDHIILHSPGLKDIPLSRPFGEEILFMDPTDSMKQEYYKIHSFYGPLEADNSLPLSDNPEAFPGGRNALMKFLASEIHYPDDAIELGVQGKVFLQIMVEADGTISAVSIAKGVCRSIDQETIRVIRKMPKLNPVELEGKPVITLYNLPVSYTLQ
jgi:TonB family protein